MAKGLSEASQVIILLAILILGLFGYYNLTSPKKSMFLLGLPEFQFLPESNVVIFESKGWNFEGSSTGTIITATDCAGIQGEGAYSASTLSQSGLSLNSESVTSNRCERIGADGYVTLLLNFDLMKVSKLFISGSGSSSLMTSIGGTAQVQISILKISGTQSSTISLPTVSATTYSGITVEKRDADFLVTFGGTTTSVNITGVNNAYLIVTASTNAPPSRQINDRFTGQRATANYIINSIAVEISTPEFLLNNEIFVFDRFSSGQIINKNTLTYAPVRYASIFPPLVLDKTASTISKDSSILDLLKNNFSYTVPSNKSVGIWYIAYKPQSLFVVCKLNEVYVVKDGTCIDSTAIVTPCTNGVLNQYGTCVVQPDVSYVCSGQVQVLADGSSVCNLILPIREQYQCLDNGVVVANAADCIRALNTTYFCGGKIIADPLSCTQNLVKTYTCNGIPIDNPNSCVQDLARIYYCVGSQIADPTQCSQNVTLQVRYICNGQEVSSPSLCVQIENVRTKYYCAGVEVSSPAQCITTIQIKYLCNVNGIVTQVNSTEDCKTVLQRQYVCGNETVESPSQCKTYLAQKYQCSDGSVVNDPNSCPSIIAQPRLQCGDRIVSDISQCTTEVLPQVTFACPKGTHLEKRGGINVCISYPPVIQILQDYWYIITLVIAIAIILLFYYFKNR